MSSPLRVTTEEALLYKTDELRHRWFRVLFFLASFRAMLGRFEVGSDIRPSEQSCNRGQSRLVLASELTPSNPGTEASLR